jgi:two-component system LytT family response regulator
MSARVLRVLVADDEQLARQRLQRLVAEIEGVSVVAECSDVEQVLAAVKEEPVDVALLDIQMPGLSGVDALALLPDGSPHVIFCTAHPDYAVKAYEGGAIDYLLKPIEAGRLRKSLDRARARLSPPEARVDRLPIATKNGVLLLDPTKISHAVLDGALVSVFAEGTAHLTDASLNELERKLPHLLRVHRRALVDLAHVERLEPLDTGGYLAHTTTKHTVEVSRQSARELRRRLGLRRGAEDDGDD